MTSRRLNRIPIRLPEPVLVEDPVWRARAWTTCFSALDHLDECLDGMKDQMVEMHAQNSASIAALTAGKLADREHFMERLDAHEAEHAELAARQAGKHSVWKLEGDLLQRALTLLTQGAAFGLIVAALKALGLV